VGARLAVAVCSAGSAGRCALKGGGGVASKSKKSYQILWQQYNCTAPGMCLRSQIDLQQWDIVLYHSKVGTMKHDMGAHLLLAKPKFGQNVGGCDFVC